MSRAKDSGRNPSSREWAETERLDLLPPSERKLHRSAIPSDPTRLEHINTYGALPEFYVDRAFACVTCGKREIWRAADQKWYYEEARGHIDAKAVRCHDCRVSRKQR